MQSHARGKLKCQSLAQGMFFFNFFLLHPITIIIVHANVWLQREREGESEQGAILKVNGGIEEENEEMKSSGIICIQVLSAREEGGGFGA